MDLQKTAEAQAERRTRSKLEPHREAIFALRRKHWTYRQIGTWLNEQGVRVTFPSVYRFCERAIARRPRNANPLPAAEPVAEPFSIQSPPAPPPTSSPANKHRFNLDL